jgi:hypothetical protein
MKCAAMPKYTLQWNTYFYFFHDAMSRVPGGGNEDWYGHRQWKWYWHWIWAAVHVHRGWNVDGHWDWDQHLLAHGVICKYRHK